MDNLTSYATCDSYPCADYNFGFFGVCVVLCVLICIGNILVIIAVWKNQKLQTISNVYVVSLAASDLAFGAISLPLRCAILLKRIYSRADTQFHLLTMIAAFIENGTIAASLTVLLLAGIERYIAIFHPFYYVREFTIRRAFTSVLASLVFHLVIHILVVILSDDKTETEHVLFFTYSNELENANEVFVLLLITTVIYVKIACVARKQRKAIAAINGSVTNKTDKGNKETKIAKMLVVILGVFYICWMPFVVLTYVFQFYFYPFGDSMSSTNKQLWFNTLFILRDACSYTNSMLNPFIYAGMNKEFKNAFLKLLLFKRTNRMDNHEMY